MVSDGGKQKKYGPNQKDKVENKKLEREKRKSGQVSSSWERYFKRSSLSGWVVICFLFKQVPWNSSPTNASICEDTVERRFVSSAHAQSRKRNFRQ